MTILEGICFSYSSRTIQGDNTLVQQSGLPRTLIGHTIICNINTYTLTTRNNKE